MPAASHTMSCCMLSSNFVGLNKNDIDWRSLAPWVIDID